MVDSESNSTKPRKMYKRITPEGVAEVKAYFESQRKSNESIEQAIRRVLHHDTEENVLMWIGIMRQIET